MVGLFKKPLPSIILLRREVFFENVSNDTIHLRFKPSPINDKPYRKQKMRVPQTKQLKQGFRFYYVPYSQLLFNLKRKDTLRRFPPT